MSFASRADLASAVAAWLKRGGDTDFTGRVPDMIRLCEARLNRVLRDPDQIYSTTLTFANGQASIPADFGELVAFGPAGYRLTQVTPGEFGTYQPSTGTPRVYTLSGGMINTLPAQAGVVPITYYRAIPALTTDGSTNWLLTRAPDLYLYGTILQAEFYGWNDERLPLVKAAFDEAIQELRADGASRRWGAAPLAPKIRRT